MKNSDDTIGNGIRDLPACSAVPQPSASPRAPDVLHVMYIKYKQMQVLILYLTYCEQISSVTFLKFRELNYIEKHGFRE